MDVVWYTEYEGHIRGLSAVLFILGFVAGFYIVFVSSAGWRYLFSFRTGSEWGVVSSVSAFVLYREC